MTSQRRKPAIEDLFDRYCQRGDVEAITVSSIPTAGTGMHLLLSCPSQHGLQRAHEALAAASSASPGAGGGGGGLPSIDAAGGGGGGGGGNGLPASSSTAYVNDSGDTEEERREKHMVRCGVETVIQLAKFKQATIDGNSAGAGVMIHAQYSDFLMTQFVAGPLLVTLSARRREGRALGMLAALAGEIRAEPVFRQFAQQAVDARIGS
jgi:hypothetical protein